MGKLAVHSPVFVLISILLNNLIIPSNLELSVNVSKPLINITGVRYAFIFETIDQVREQSQKWMNDYNNFRPHESLGNIPPKVYVKSNN